MACITCNKKIPTNDPVVKCTICGDLFDYSCAKVTVTDARALADPQKNRSHLCSKCKTDIPQMKQQLEALKKEMEDLRIAAAISPTYVDAPTEPDVTVRLDAMERKLDDFMNRFDFDRIITLAVEKATANMASTVAKVAAQAACEAVFAATNENQELEKKKLNVVVFGLHPNPDCDDLTKVREMAVSAGITENSIQSCFRAGPTMEDKPRLLKVKMSDESAKNRFIQAGREKQFGEDIYIRRDLTYRERQARKRRANIRTGAGAGGENLSTVSFAPVFEAGSDNANLS